MLAVQPKRYAQEDTVCYPVRPPQINGMLPEFEAARLGVLVALPQAFGLLQDRHQRRGQRRLIGDARRTIVNSGRPEGAAADIPRARGEVGHGRRKFHRAKMALSIPCVEVIENGLLTRCLCGGEGVKSCHSLVVRRSSSSRRKAFVSSGGRQWPFAPNSQDNICNHIREVPFQLFCIPTSSRTKQ
jgi:hypothetical protein